MRFFIKTTHLQISVCDTVYLRIRIKYFNVICSLDYVNMHCSMTRYKLSSGWNKTFLLWTVKQRSEGVVAVTCMLYIHCTDNKHTSIIHWNPHAYLLIPSVGRRTHEATEAYMHAWHLKVNSKYCSKYRSHYYASYQPCTSIPPCPYLEFDVDFAIRISKERQLPFPFYLLIKHESSYNVFTYAL